MKKDIHPKYEEKVLVQCACGAKYHVGSTQKEIKIDVCSECHPFYTGEHRVLDTEGRVEKFNKKFNIQNKK